MTDPEVVWRAKSDDEVVEAALDLSEYTEEGERIIRAELRRRGLPMPDPSIGKCSRCGRSISHNQQDDECSQCGEPFPPEILRALGAAAVDTGSGATRAETVGGEPLTVKWEQVASDGASFSLYRSKVPGGWLVASGTDGPLTFIPDAEYKWNENSS